MNGKTTCMQIMQSLVTRIGTSVSGIQKPLKSSWTGLQYTDRLGNETSSSQIRVQRALEIGSLLFFHPELICLGKLSSI